MGCSMIVTIDIFLTPEKAVQLVAFHACNDVLPRTKHEFDNALRSAARQSFQDGYDDTQFDEPRSFNDSGVNLRARVELLTRSARKGGWLT